MKKIFIAKTVDEAKANAISEFNVDISRITFTVLEEPKKSLFGKLKGDAKVEAGYEPNKVEFTCEYIAKCLKHMGIQDVKISITENENGAVLDIAGSDTDMIIGNNGDTLDALQYLASLVCNRNDKEYYRISLDCNGYRAKRKTQLEGLAARIAENVKKTGRNSSLEAMNPYERRIIHAALSEIEGVSSHSTGDEPFRRVIVVSTVKRPEKREGNRGQRNNFRDKETRQRKPRETQKSYDITTSFEKDYKKPKPEDNINSGLYSKIEF